MSTQPESLLSLHYNGNTLRCLQEQREKNELCDTIIVCSEGHQTVAHSCVVATHSSVIATVLHNRLLAQHDWSILKPLVINIDEVSAKNPAQQDGEAAINPVEILVNLMYGEIVCVGEIHIPLLNEYAHILGISDKILASLNGNDKKYGNNERRNPSNKFLTFAESGKKFRSDESEDVNVSCTANPVHPSITSSSCQEKQFAFAKEPEYFDEKEQAANLLSFSVLCNESQDEDSNISRDWREDLVYEKHCHVDSQDSNVLICKVDQSMHQEPVGNVDRDNQDINLFDMAATSSGVSSHVVAKRTSTEEHQQRVKKQVKKSLICTVCRSAFQKWGDLVKHVQNMNHFTVRCPLCFLQVEDSENQRLHFALHDQGLPFFCMYCDQRFRTRAALTMHTPKHMTSKPFVCSDCGRGFKWRHALHAHLYTHSQTSCLLCDKCGFSSKYVTSFKAHLLQHSGRAFCCPQPGCTFTSNRKTHLNDHLASHSKTRVHQCDVCGHSFSHARNMRRHMRLHAPASNLLSCVLFSKLQCSFRTTRPDKLRDHLFRKHNIKPESVPTKLISKWLKPSILHSSQANPCRNQPVSSFSAGHRHLKFSPNFPKRIDVSLNEKNNENFVEVQSMDKGNIFSLQSPIISVIRNNEQTKNNSVGIENEEKVIFASSPSVTKDINIGSDEEAFSVFISTQGIVELCDIQNSKNNPKTKEKEREVAEVTDNSQSNFLIENDILSGEDSNSVSEPCLNAKSNITVLETCVPPELKQKVMTITTSLDDQHLGLVQTSSINALTYSSYCTGPDCRDNVVLEVEDSSEEISSTSSVQVSVSKPTYEGSSVQEKPLKEEQCMESLTILELMLDSVTN